MVGLAKIITINHLWAHHPSYQFLVGRRFEFFDHLSTSRINPYTWHYKSKMEARPITFRSQGQMAAKEGALGLLIENMLLRNSNRLCRFQKAVSVATLRSSPLIYIYKKTFRHVKQEAKNSCQLATS